MGRIAPRFQTNPRGVEAIVSMAAVETTVGFRRTLVGLKLDPEDAVMSVSDSFRRTLVGLKPGPALSLSFNQHSFRRTLVGLKLALIRRSV